MEGATTPAADFSQLIVCAGPYNLEATLTDTAQRVWHQLVARSWRCEPCQALRRLEDTIYESPALFRDIHTTLLVRPTVTTLVPSALLEDDENEAAQAIMKQFDPTTDTEVRIQKVDQATSLLYSTPAGTHDFLSRSFPSEKITHALTPLINYFAATAAREGGERVWVDIRPGILDIVAMRRGSLILANSFNFREATDAAYYLVYTWRTLGIDNSEGELYICGEEATRREVTDLLRRHINYVAMPRLATPIKAALAQNISLSTILAAAPAANQSANQ